MVSMDHSDAPAGPQVCIAAQMRLHLRVRPAMKWLVMDATAMKVSPCE